MRTTLFVLLSTGLVVSGNSAAETTPSVSQVLRIIINRSDDLMRRSLILTIGAEFVKRSPTFSDLLRRLRDARHVLLYLQFALLRPPPPSGRTRFEIAPSGLVVGFIEIDAAPTFPLSRHGAIVAHELAHAYEVSCLSDVRTTEELLQKLRARAGPDGGGISTETPFATAIEKAVLDEWSGGARVASQLPALSAKYDLSACLSPAHRP
jgi:hypothetical protein